MHKKKFSNNAILAMHQLPDFLQNRLLVTPVQAGAFLSWAPQTVYNKLNKKKFPLPLVPLGSKKMVRTSDLLEFIAKLRLPDIEVAGDPCKVGHPGKSELIRRRTEKLGVEK